MSVVLEIVVPDFFPADWVDESTGDDEECAIVLHRKARWFRPGRPYRLPFRARVPRRPGESLRACFTHIMTETVVPTRATLECSGPCGGFEADCSLKGKLLCAGDTVHMDVEVVLR